jgi:hypothetical protein
MTTAYLTVGAVVGGGSADWSTVGGDPLNTDDGDTSYVGCNDNSAPEDYELSDFALNVKIDQVYISSWKARASNATTRDTRLGLVLGGSVTYGATRTVPLSGSYTTYSELALARPGGGTWSAADLSSLRLRLETTQTVANSNVRITYVVVAVDYSEVGGFVCVVP